MLACESFNLTKPKARADFARSLAEGRKGIDKQAIEAELLQIAGEAASKPDDTPPDFSSLPEIDASRIVRPERAITPEVSTVAVPTMASLGERVAGRWHL